jgi:hypothetical protein
MGANAAAIVVANCVSYTRERRQARRKQANRPSCNIVGIIPIHRGWARDSREKQETQSNAILETFTVDLQSLFVLDVTCTNSTIL